MNNQGAPPLEYFFPFLAPAAGISARRHFDQTRVEVGQNFHQIVLSGHDRVNILVGHGRFIQTAGNKVYAHIFQRAAGNFRIKLCDGRRAAHQRGYRA